MLYPRNSVCVLVLSLMMLSLPGGAYGQDTDPGASAQKLDAIEPAPPTEPATGADPATDTAIAEPAQAAAAAADAVEARPTVRTDTILEKYMKDGTLYMKDGALPPEFLTPEFQQRARQFLLTAWSDYYKEEAKQKAKERAENGVALQGSDRKRSSVPDLKLGFDYRNRSGGSLALGGAYHGKSSGELLKRRDGWSDNTRDDFNYTLEGGLLLGSTRGASTVPAASAAAEVSLPNSVRFGLLGDEYATRLEFDRNLALERHWRVAAAMGIKGTAGVRKGNSLARGTSFSFVEAGVAESGKHVLPLVQGGAQATGEVCKITGSRGQHWFCLSGRARGALGLVQIETMAGGGVDYIYKLANNSSKALEAIKVSGGADAGMILDIDGAHTGARTGISVEVR